jgi:poly(3-hydroxybutyrate) depolymerase
MLYQAYQAHSDLLWPLRAMARAAVPLLQGSGEALALTPSQRHFAAAC